MSWLALCVGAALGAVARYLTDRAVQARHDTSFPWGTLVVNVVGSLVLGVLLGAASRRDVPPAVVLGVGTGFCGALTTYSTFGYETVGLAERGERWRAAANVLASVAGAIGAGALGWLLGAAL